MIEQYFQSHLNLLATLPFVENPQINFEKRADMVGFVRGAIEFTDGSALHYRELVDWESQSNSLVHDVNNEINFNTFSSLVFTNVYIPHPAHQNHSTTA